MTQHAATYRHAPCWALLLAVLVGLAPAGVAAGRALVAPAGQDHVAPSGAAVPSPALLSAGPLYTALVAPRRPIRIAEGPAHSAAAAVGRAPARYAEASPVHVLPAPRAEGPSTLRVLRI